VNFSRMMLPLTLSERRNPDHLSRAGHVQLAVEPSRARLSFSSLRSNSSRSI
jgi:hypothetical protein